MLKKLGMIFLVTSISALLSSCHIKQKDVETIKRTTEKLRIYQPDDFIVYNVTALTDSDTPSRGTLRIEWDATADLLDPIDNNTQYQVLKETTTLTYEENSIEADVIVIRYISQDTDGNITLYAIDDGTVPRYWLHDLDDAGNLSANISTPVIFDSPIAIGSPPNTSFDSPVRFTVMEGCTSGSCASEVYTFNDGFDIVGDTTEVTTNLGKFSDPFEINFRGGSTADGASTVSVLGDIRNACGTSADTILHSGTIFVVPEIGIVQMSNLCQNLTGSQVQYIITINNTNIPLPAPTP